MPRMKRVKCRIKLAVLSPDCRTKANTQVMEAVRRKGKKQFLWDVILQGEIVMIVSDGDFQRDFDIVEAESVGAGP